MTEDIDKINHSEWDNMTSSERNSTCNEKEYPVIQLFCVFLIAQLLVAVARYLTELHSPNIPENMVETFASGDVAF